MDPFLCAILIFTSRPQCSCTLPNIIEEHSGLFTSSKECREEFKKCYESFLANISRKDVISNSTFTLFNRDFRGSIKRVNVLSDFKIVNVIFPNESTFTRDSEYPTFFHFASTRLSFSRKCIDNIYKLGVTTTTKSRDKCKFSFIDISVLNFEKHAAPSINVWQGGVLKEAIAYKVLFIISRPAIEKTLDGNITLSPTLTVELNGKELSRTNKTYSGLEPLSVEEFLKLLVNKMDTKRIKSILNFLPDLVTTLRPTKHILALVPNRDSTNHLFGRALPKNPIRVKRQSVLSFVFKENCPRKCSCTIKGESEIIVTVNCENKFLSFAPSAIPFGSTIVKLGRNNLKSLSNIDHFWWQKVTYLDLTENQFVYLEYAHVPFGVTTLDISFNSISGISPLFREKVRNTTGYRVFLSGNKWICSCQHVNLIQWFKMNSEKIGDYGNVVCYWFGNVTHKVKTIPLHLYCSRKIFPISYAIKYIITLVLLSLPLLLMFTFLYNRRMTIFSILHQYKLYPKWFDKKAIDENMKLYDLFICYHMKDREIVNIAINILGPSYRVCIQEHSWIPKPNAGRDLLFRFFSSKRMLVVVSRRFGKSSWFQTEFRDLYHKELKFHLYKLIIMIIKEPGRDYYLEPMVQTFYPTEYILIWGERWLWTKLRFLLRNVNRIAKV